MKSLTCSCLICALNLYFAQKLLRKAKFANLVPRVLSYHHGNEVARTAKSCSKRQKMLKSCWAQSEKV